MTKLKTKVLIIGAGFGGVAVALTLARRHRSDLGITLISNKPHLEYSPALYRVVIGRSPLEVCIPLAEIFRHKQIDVVIDEITDLDPAQQTAHGFSGRRYAYDYVVLALGSETAYFDIPGLREFSFGFKSIQNALRLERHLQGLFTTCNQSNPSLADKICLLHLVVVGAGPAGVELAGELVGYLKQLAERYQTPKNLVTIDLFDGAERILPTLPLKVSERVARRLRALGVNIFVNRPMVREEAEVIVLRGLQTQTETVIWTAGVKPNSFFQKISGLVFDQKGRVIVDEYLLAKNQKRIFVIGDGAATPFAGLAQTAIYDGQSVAANLIQLNRDRTLKPYRPKRPFHAIPVGRDWGVVILGPLALYGRLAWFIRRLADLRYCLSILPWSKAWLAFHSNKRLSESN